MRKKHFTLVILSFLLLAGCQKATRACFTVSAGTVSVSTTVIFNSSCSENAGFYSWDFGDGTPQTEVMTSDTISHAYSAPGHYTVTLNASRKDGFSLGKDKPVISELIIVQ